MRAKITHLGYALDILTCDPLLVRNISRKVSHGNYLITLCGGGPARSARCAAVGVRPTGSRPLTLRLADNPAFLNAHVLPLLQKKREVRNWYVAHICNGPDDSYSLQVFFWPEGSRTKIHDHTSWGANCCVVGSVLEERYERLDDGFVLEHARLKKVWQLWWNREDGASTVLPGGWGIHRVGNPGTKMAISMHLYGPPIGGVDGRDYDPSKNYVCDRLEA